jgi:two-component system NtrC family sensor kinase
MNEPESASPPPPDRLDAMLRLIEVIGEARLKSEKGAEGLDVEELEAMIVERTWTMFGVQASSLFLAAPVTDPDHAREMLFKSTAGRELPWDYRVLLEGTTGLVSHCMRSHQPLLINDVSTWPDFNPVMDAPPQGENTYHDVRSMVCVPLLTKGTLLGALQIINKDEGDFTQYDLGLLLLEASSLANTIYNSRLIQELQITNAELEANRWKLLSSQNTLRALFDTIPSGIYIITLKYQLVAVNMARAQKSGLQKPEDIPPLIGRICYEALVGRDSPCPGCKVLETLYAGRNTNSTERRWENEEEPTEWEISTYPIFDEDNQPVQAILLEQNVTDKRRLEATLAQSEKLAAVGQLAAGVAHEINNPLTAIIANAQLLQREISGQSGLQGKEDIDESLDLILRAGARAIQVVRNLLNFARKEKYELKPVDVNDNIREALSLLNHEIMQRSIQLFFEPAKGLPDISASANHLQGVWLNLLINAMDALENGQGTIRINTMQNGNNIQVKVVDTGKGIPAERMSRIFEPFYTTKAPNRGTGLGLSVCHRIVKQHGGHILVDSHVDVGTEFTVVLPIAAPN